MQYFQKCPPKKVWQRLQVAYAKASGPEPWLCIPSVLRDLLPHVDRRNRAQLLRIAFWTSTHSRSTYAFLIPTTAAQLHKACTRDEFSIYCSATLWATKDALSFIFLSGKRPEDLID